VNPDDDHAFGPAVAFQYLVGNSADRSTDVLAAHHLGHRRTSDADGL
jgi:hypothetical protein